MSPDTLSVLLDDRRRAIAVGYARARRYDRALARLGRGLRAALRLSAIVAIALLGCIADDDASFASAQDVG